jgi:hypothetical protein
LALRRVEAARRGWPVEDDSFLTTLAIAQYRTRDHAAALATLDRLAALRAAPAGEPALALALRTMAEQALGHHEQARRAFERLQVSLQADEEAQSDLHTQGFVVEARAALARGGR